MRAPPSRPDRSRTRERLLPLALLLALGAGLSGCAQVDLRPGVSADTTLTGFSLAVTVYDHGRVNLYTSVTKVGSGPVELRLPRDVIVEKFEVNPNLTGTAPVSVARSQDGDDLVFQFSGSPLPGDEDLNFTARWSLTGVIQQEPNGAGSLELAPLGGVSGLRVPVATIYTSVSTLPAPDQYTCLQGNACRAEFDQSGSVRFAATDLVLDGSGTADRLRVRLHWPQGTFDIPFDNRLMLNIASAIGVVAVSILTILAAVVAGRLIMGREWKSEFKKAWRDATDRSGPTKLFRFSQRWLTAIGAFILNNLLQLSFVWMIAGTVFLFASMGAGFLVYGPEGTDLGVFWPMIIFGIFGGFGGPILLLAGVGIPIGSVIGGQALHRHGYLVSVPFALWFPWGLILRYWLVENDLLPDWIAWIGYLAVLAVLSSGWFLLGWLGTKEGEPLPWDSTKKKIRTGTKRHRSRGKNSADS